MKRIKRILFLRNLFSKTVVKRTLKYTLFVTILFLLLIIWKIVFILQGGIGLQGLSALIPFKLLPIFLYSYLVFWIFLVMFISRIRINKRKRVSVIAGALAVILSICFQNYYISTRVPNFSFTNKMFSHLPTINVTNHILNRTILSYTEYTKLLPLNRTDSDIAQLLSNTAAEGAFFFTIKNLLSTSSHDYICKKYIERYKSSHNCIMDFHKNILSSLHFSPSGNVLLMAVWSLGIFKEKKSPDGIVKKSHFFITLKSVNDIIEASTIVMERSKNIFLSRNKPIISSFDFEINPSSLLSNIQQIINLKMLSVSTKQVRKMTAQASKHIYNYENNKHQQINPSDKNLKIIEDEIKRFKNLQLEFLKAQENGFKSDDIKDNIAKLKIRAQKDFKQIKTKSLFYKTAVLIKPSVEERMQEMLK